MSDLTKMSEAEFAEYGLKILHALPFADNDAGLPQTAEFIREQARRLTAAAERVGEVERLKAEVTRLNDEVGFYRESATLSPAPATWLCACGYGNVAAVCTKCGQIKPPATHNPAPNVSGGGGSDNKVGDAIAPAVGEPAEKPRASPIEWLGRLLNSDGEYEGYGVLTHTTIAVLIQDYMDYASGREQPAQPAPTPAPGGAP